MGEISTGTCKGFGWVNSTEVKQKRKLTDNEKNIPFSTIINFVFINFTGSWEKSVNNL